MARMDAGRNDTGSQPPGVRHSTFSARILGRSTVGRSMARSDTGAQTANGDSQRGSWDRCLEDPLTRPPERTGRSIADCDTREELSLTNRHTSRPRSASLGRGSAGHNASQYSADVFDSITAPVVDEASVQSTIAQSLELLATLDRDATTDDATYPNPQAHTAAPRRQAPAWQSIPTALPSGTVEQAQAQFKLPLRGLRHASPHQDTFPHRGSLNTRNAACNTGVGTIHVPRGGGVSPANVHGETTGAFSEDPLDASVEQAIRNATLACRASADILANSRRRAGDMRHSASSSVSTFPKGHVAEGPLPIPKNAAVRQSHLILGTLQRDLLGHAGHVQQRQPPAQGSAMRLGPSETKGGAVPSARGRPGVGRSLGGLDPMGRRDPAWPGAAKRPATVLLPHGRTTVLTGSARPAPPGTPQGLAINWNWQASLRGQHASTTPPEGPAPRQWPPTSTSSAPLFGSAHAEVRAGGGSRGGDKSQTSGDSGVSRRLSFSRPMPVPGAVVEVAGPGTSDDAFATLPHQTGQGSGVQINAPGSLGFGPEHGLVSSVHINAPGSPGFGAEHGHANAPKPHLHADSHAAGMGGPRQAVSSDNFPPNHDAVLHQPSGMAGGGGFSSLADMAATAHPPLAEASRSGPLQEVEHDASVAEAHVSSEPCASRGERRGEGLRSSGQEEDLGVLGREHGLGLAGPKGGTHAVGHLAAPVTGLGTAVCAPWVASLDAQVQHASNSEAAHRDLRQHPQGPPGKPPCPLPASSMSRHRIQSPQGGFYVRATPQKRRALVPRAAKHAMRSMLAGLLPDQTYDVDAAAQTPLQVPQQVYQLTHDMARSPVTPRPRRRLPVQRVGASNQQKEPLKGGKGTRGAGSKRQGPGERTAKGESRSARPSDQGTDLAGRRAPDPPSACATDRVTHPSSALPDQAARPATSAWAVEPSWLAPDSKPSGESPSPPRFSPGVVVTQRPAPSPKPSGRGSEPGPLGSNPGVLATPQRPPHSILAIAQWTMQDIGAATPATEVRIGSGPGEGGSSPIAAPSTVRKGRHLANWQPLLNSYAGAASVMVPDQAAPADPPADWPASGSVGSPLHGKDRPMPSPVQELLRACQTPTSPAFPWMQSNPMFDAHLADDTEAHAYPEQESPAHSPAMHRNPTFNTPPAAAPQAHPTFSPLRRSLSLSDRPLMSYTSPVTPLQPGSPCEAPPDINHDATPQASPAEGHATTPGSASPAYGVESRTGVDVGTLDLSSSSSSSCWTEVRAGSCGASPRLSPAEIPALGGMRQPFANISAAILNVGDSGVSVVAKRDPPGKGLDRCGQEQLVESRPDDGLPVEGAGRSLHAGSPARYPPGYLQIHTSADGPARASHTTGCNEVASSAPALPISEDENGAVSVSWGSILEVSQGEQGLQGTANEPPLPTVDFGPLGRASVNLPPGLFPDFARRHVGAAHTPGTSLSHSGRASVNLPLQSGLGQESARGLTGKRGAAAIRGGPAHPSRASVDMQDEPAANRWGALWETGSFTPDTSSGVAEASAACSGNSSDPFSGPESRYLPAANGGLLQQTQDQEGRESRVRTAGREGLAGVAKLAAQSDIPLGHSRALRAMQTADASQSSGAVSRGQCGAGEPAAASSGEGATDGGPEMVGQLRPAGPPGHMRASGTQQEGERSTPGFAGVFFLGVSDPEPRGPAQSHLRQGFKAGCSFAPVWSELPESRSSLDNLLRESHGPLERVDGGALLVPSTLAESPAVRRESHGHVPLGGNPERLAAGSDMSLNNRAGQHTIHADSAHGIPSQAASPGGSPAGEFSLEDGCTKVPLAEAPTPNRRASPPSGGAPIRGRGTEGLTPGKDTGSLEGGLRRDPYQGVDTADGYLPHPDSTAASPVKAAASQSGDSPQASPPRSADAAGVDISIPQHEAAQSVRNDLSRRQQEGTSTASHGPGRRHAHSLKQPVADYGREQLAHQTVCEITPASESPVGKRMGATGWTATDVSHRRAFGEISAVSTPRMGVPIDRDDLAGIEAFLQSELEDDDLLYVESVLLDSGVDEVGLIRTESVTMIAGGRRRVAPRLIGESFEPLGASMDVLRRSDAVWQSRQGTLAASRQGFEQEHGEGRSSQDALRQGPPDMPSNGSNQPELPVLSTPARQKMGSLRGGLSRFAARLTRGPRHPNVDAERGGKWQLFKKKVSRVRTKAVTWAACRGLATKSPPLPHGKAASQGSSLSNERT